MPATVIPIRGPLSADFAVLSVAPAGAAEIPFGIVLLDAASGELIWKFREDLDDLPLPPEDIEYLSWLHADFSARTREIGGAEFLAGMEDSLSGFLRISNREKVTARSLPGLLDRLFSEHVDTRVRPFVTHLPYYQLRAAATRFGEDLEVSESEIEWLRAPSTLRMSPDLFVVRVVGRSMEPLIPDGSLAVFRRFGAGSRQGRRLLIQERGTSQGSAEFTVKRYTSSKRPTGDESWEHARIRLEPLNPEFEAFDLSPEEFADRYRVIGEFVQVLPPELQTGED